MALSDDNLWEMRSSASTVAKEHPKLSSDQRLPEEERQSRLQELREIAAAIEADTELRPDDRRHVVALVSQLMTALESAPEAGSVPIEMAAKTIVLDSHISPNLWRRVAGRPWAIKLGTAVMAVIMAVTSAYPGAKEIGQDLGSWLQLETSSSQRVADSQPDGTTEPADSPPSDEPG